VKAREYDDICDGLRVEAALFRANKTYENAKCTELCQEGDVLVHLGRWELLNLRSGEHVDPPKSILKHISNVLIQDGMGHHIFRQLEQLGVPKTCPPFWGKPDIAKLFAQQPVTHKQAYNTGRA